MTYFEVFGLEPSLTVDEAALQTKFYQLSRQYHPDRFASKPAEEQQRALDLTAELNDGYRVLRDPIRRAEYLLKQEGFDIGEQRSKDVPPELLEEVFELNMMLESAPGPDELAEAKQKFTAMQAEVDSGLQDLSRRYDESRETAVLSEIRGLLNRRRYIQNLLRDVEQHANL